MNGTSPHGLHITLWIFEQTGHTDCRFCGALPDAPCNCERGSFHLARFDRAQAEDRISRRDLAWMIPDGDDFTGATVIGRDVA